MSLTLQPTTVNAFDLYELRASRDWLMAGKSSVAELPLNLTWNIDASWDPSLRAHDFLKLSFFRGAAFRMTG
jgi:hypothetical protein